MQPRPPSRLGNYHSSKRQLLGYQAGQVPPAWKDQRQKEQGSKILLSRLPPDVGELEVEESHHMNIITIHSDAYRQQELFRKTVGPLKEAFLIYNSQGRSKGMAVVSFQRPGDAAVARTKYDGKFIDGRRPIKIEIVMDSNHPAVSPPPAQAQPSLLVRLGGIVATNTPSAIVPHNHAPNGHAPPAASHKQHAPRAVHTAPLAVTPRRRQRKGPRRVKKTVTLAQLDQEMEDYRAAGPMFGPNGK